MSEGRIEVNGQVHVADQYQIPYKAFEKYINGIDPKQMKAMSALDLMRKSFEFGYMYVELDKEDMLGRIANLNEQNLKWFTKADTLEQECNLLKEKILRISGAQEEMSKSLPSNPSSSPDSEESSEASESLLKRPEVLEDSLISTAVTPESTLS